MTNVFSLQETFQGKVFQVPDYQRGYAWERRQRDELLEGLEFLVAGKDHRTGNLLFPCKPGTGMTRFCSRQV